MDIFMRKKRIMPFVFMFMQLIYINNAYAYSDIENKVFVEDKLCEVKAFDQSNPDKKPSLLLQMTVKKHASGVAYALDFELINNTNKSLVIRIPSDNAERFMPIIRLNNGQEISNEHKHYKMDGLEQPSFENIIIKAGGTKKWLLNLKDILQTKDAVKKALVNDTEGRLKVFFYFRYFLEDSDCDKQYKDAEMVLYQNEYFSLESYTLPN